MKEIFVERKENILRIAIKNKGKLQEVIFEEEIPKSIGNSITLPKDYTDINELNKVLLFFAKRLYPL